MHEDFTRIEVLLADDSFIRWIENKASQKEEEQWTSWLEEDPARKKLVAAARRIHTGFSFKRKKYTEVDQELAKLNSAVDKAEDPKKSLENGTTKSRRYLPDSYRPFAAAAVLLLAVLAGSLYFLLPAHTGSDSKETAFVTKTTSFGEKKLLTLFDGSTVLMNSNSSLRIPETHTGSYDLWLEGEAYFVIDHKQESQKRRVTVHTQDGEIRVFGTEFNVNTFEKGTEVMLKKGSIEVGAADTTGTFYSRRLMKPGEVGRFSASGSDIHIREGNPELYTGWTRGKLFFDQSTVADVARRLEQLYGVRITVKDEIADVEISGSIPNDNLQVLLDGLEKILQQPIEKKSNKIWIGATGEENAN